jgi:hypothetical protein
MCADGRLFYTREIHIWIFCQLKKWSQNKHTRYVLTKKCIRERANSEGCLGETQPPHFFEKKIVKNVFFFYNIKNHPLIFFQNPLRAFGSPFCGPNNWKKCGVSGCAIIYMSL